MRFWGDRREIYQKTLRISLQAEAKNPVSSDQTLVSGMIESWDASAAFPLAQIRSSLGQAGCLATESKVSISCTITCNPLTSSHAKERER